MKHLTVKEFKEMVAALPEGLDSLTLCCLNIYGHNVDTHLEPYIGSTGEVCLIPERGDG
jgi:hypothetical protein